MQQHQSSAWLINTGWSGGGFGEGKRINLAYTRAIIDAIHDGSLKEAPTIRDRFFGLETPTRCPNVPDSILQPRNTWHNASAYDAAARQLAHLFRNNFKTYADAASPEVVAAGPAEE
jgi:phosphoenolpyruvate carboxykinase (ATP)